MEEEIRYNHKKSFKIVQFRPKTQQIDHHGEPDESHNNRNPSVEMVKAPRKAQNVDSRAKLVPKHFVEKYSAAVAVVYSGPTSLDINEGKHWLHLKNFDYFLEHGIECVAHDTIIVLTPSVAKYYEGRIRDIQEQCKTLREREHGASNKGSAVRVVEREDKCYDMESLRVVLENFDLSLYDFLVYLNCGVVGPKLPEPTNDAVVVHPTHLPWTYRYTSLLSASVKMSGLSINSFGVHPHVQSMLFAVDKAGLEIIKNSGAVYDCGVLSNNLKGAARWELINNFELEMGRAILGAGYHIHSTHGPYGPVEIRPQDVGTDLQWCLDIWFPHSIPVNANSKWEDFMFFKSTRMFLLPGMEEEIRYNRNSSFEIVKLPSKAPHPDANLIFGNLWSGGARKKLVPNQPNLAVSIVVSHCRGDLSWLKDYLSDAIIQNVTVVSKCDIVPDSSHLPEGTTLMTLPNMGRVDQTMAYWMAEVIPRQSKVDSDDEIVFFLKDNLIRHPPRLRRGITELLDITAVNGFTCLQKPPSAQSQFHQTDALSHFNMSYYWGNHKYGYREDGSVFVIN
jgi:hypothetical protein